MKRHLLNIGLALGMLTAVPAFAHERGGGDFNGGGLRGGGPYHGTHHGGAYGRGYYRGGGYRPYYRPFYSQHRRWVPGYRLATPYCIAYPYEAECVVGGYWVY